ncbi:hypothetical protein GCM10010145_54790 [Streptomyces ruber]|uniref:Uncharacterized protein n=2 Tax=Streptomyces TaxID=1883 RepID=A0A918BNI3_9ACTN|nr:hypothetical protein [Streptomyces ruber]GGQ78226.1 hypothetical protein GCM10010145_54790 [Streptomyces ruber]
MSAASSAGYPESGMPRATYAGERVGEETKPSYKTTELMAFVAAVVAVLIASAVVGDDARGVDRFPAGQAWLYVTLLTIGYMISRGLAKSGSRGRDDGARV